MEVTSREFNLTEEEWNEWCNRQIKLIRWHAVCRSQLGHNLFMAGALTEAFNLGWNACVLCPF